MTPPSFLALCNQADSCGRPFLRPSHLIRTMAGPTIPNPNPNPLPPPEPHIPLVVDPPDDKPHLPRPPIDPDDPAEPNRM